MRTRRGVERHPTGDADVLSQMMYQSASIREPQRRRPTRNDKEVDEEEDGTTKTQQESCDEEEIVAAVEEEPKKKEGPIRTRRGVQRKSTGDSDQLGLMLYGMANPKRCEASDTAGVPTEISLSSASPSTSDAATATTTAEPRRRGRRKATVNADDSEHVDDSTNNGGDNWMHEWLVVLTAQ